MQFRSTHKNPALTQVVASALFTKVYFDRLSPLSKTIELDLPLLTSEAVNEKSHCSNKYCPFCSKK